jgi:hypothetical protein
MMFRDNENENTEPALKDFLTHELGITNANELNFQNVHRLRKRTDGKPRSIIARFTNYIYHERVFKPVPEALKGKPYLSVHQQYPTEINTQNSVL